LGFDLKEYLENKRKEIDKALDSFLPEPEGLSAPLFEAMRYSVMAGGKRLRPILVLAASHAVGGSSSVSMPAACALEFIHTYSLIHDDLPAMDDDDLRRGRPTCHKVFGEAMAILAGDGLLTFAFEILAREAVKERENSEKVSQVILILARAAGIKGMVVGQAVDVLMENKEVNGSQLAFIHQHKTGALIKASVEIGGLLGGADQNQLGALSSYGDGLGLAFQIVDDLLDIEGDQEVIGKPVGSDLEKNKATYPALFGIEESRAQAHEYIHSAISALASFDEKAEPLRAIANYVIQRNR